MRQIKGFHLEVNEFGDAEEPPATLFQARRGIEMPTRGRSLEAQFETTDDEFLMVVTDNWPYEETLRILLIDGDGQLIDSLESTGPNELLVVRSVEVDGKRAIRLEVNHDEAIQVEVSKNRLNPFARWKHWLKRTQVGEQGRLLLRVE